MFLRAPGPLQDSGQPARRSSRAGRIAAAAALLAALLAGGLLYAAWRLGEPLLLGPPPAGRQEASVVAAGDVAGCWWRADEATARLLDRTDGVVLGLGDLVYSSGSDAEYRRCYGPTWGRHRARTRPVPGNHDLYTDGGAPYYRYFGARAGPSGRGWYSFDVAGWHVVALNSVADAGEGSPQLRWLRADLAAHPARCTLAYWHHPRFSSGTHGGQARMSAAWAALREAGAEVVLSGHDHDYERFAPMTAEGALDPAHGVRQFVVGTGGAPLYRLREPQPHSEARTDHVHGVLLLKLEPRGYAWRFLSIGGAAFRDAGRADCHDPPAPRARAAGGAGVTPAGLARP